MVNPVLSIDVSKSVSHAALFLSHGQLYQKPFRFTHSPDGVSYLVDSLRKVELETSVKPKVVLEATGNYSKPLVKFFGDEGYDVVVLNPIETHLLKKKAIRKIKTDPIDVNRIAEVYYSNKFVIQAVQDSSVSELRNLCRHYSGLTDLFTETQLRFRSVLDLLFPNFDRTFHTVCSKTALHFLSLFPSPSAVLAADRKDLLAALKLAKHHKTWNEEKVDKILLAAKESLPDTSAQQSNIRVLQDYIRILMTQHNILADIRAQMTSQASLSPQFELLLSIPGVGELTATTILSEIGDINRFPTTKQLVAFAGLDPSVYQSGKFTASNNKISKRGSTYLRKALYQSTIAGIMKRTNGPKNTLLYSFFAKKIAEGKPHRVAIIATSNKLLKIIFGILRSRKPFMCC